jgi:DNA polymerase
MIRIEDSPHALRAALEWQIELGADEAVADAPADRYAENAALLAARAEKAAAPEKPDSARPAARAPVISDDEAKAENVQAAREAAAACDTLEALAEAVAAFDRCDLKKGARNTVFADGNPAARLMVVGEAPGRDEDREGKPFVGRSGQLLDRMLAAIGLDRRAEDPATAVYISNVIPWRPLENRNPSDDEVAMMLPFIERHIELAKPEVLLFLGNTPTKALLGTTQGITRMRGTWGDWRGIPAMPSFHPAYLLRQPHLKRESWKDLQAVRDRLAGG